MLIHVSLKKERRRDMRTQECDCKKPTKMVKIIKAPIRAIYKALNLYVKCVINFSDAYNRPLQTAVDVTPNPQRLQRSFTTSRLPDNDQPIESALVRSISTGAVGGRDGEVRLTNFELYITQRQCQRLQLCASSKDEPRTYCSVLMGKIDEDRASSFRNDTIILRGKFYVKDEHSLFV
ncbi:hypothetical protein QVD17_36011 [Tagetes erecta]|uniref:Uncharacterized protein n=1 Tax=Tagetes erecta TaxID=13708 RepID=A0AAD8NBK7_TARER|nr:hypothetical protein QVD17_36011 [Tagetes erecta]